MWNANKPNDKTNRKQSQCKEQGARTELDTETEGNTNLDGHGNGIQRSLVAHYCKCPAAVVTQALRHNLQTAPCLGKFCILHWDSQMNRKDCKMTADSEPEPEPEPEPVIVAVAVANGECNNPTCHCHCLIWSNLRQFAKHCKDYY